MQREAASGSENIDTFDRTRLKKLNTGAGPNAGAGNWARLTLGSRV